MEHKNYMDLKIKNALGISAVVALLLVSFGFMSYVDTYSKTVEPSSFRSFNVTGEGRIVAVPDIAAFYFSIITEGGNDIAALQNQNIAKTNQAIAYLKNQGVESRDIQTLSYDLQPRYQSFNCNPPVIYRGITPAPESDSSSPSSGAPDRVASTLVSPIPPINCPPSKIVGYTINQTVNVKIRDFSKIGNILSGVVSAGANSTSGLSFTVDDPSELQNQARVQAIEKAEKRAQDLAKAAGFRIGKLISIDENTYVPYIYQRESAKDQATAPGAAPAPTIEPGSQNITATVTLRYEIK